MHKMFKMLSAALVTAFGLSAYAGHDFTYRMVNREPTNTWIGASGAYWSVGSNWEKGVAVTNREYALINTPAGVTISEDKDVKGFAATGIIVAPEAGPSGISAPTTWGTSGLVLRRNDSTRCPSLINLSDYPFELDVLVSFKSNGNGDAALLPNFVYKRDFSFGKSYGTDTIHFMAGTGSIEDSWNTSTFKKGADCLGHPVEIQNLHRVLLDGSASSLSAANLIVNGKVDAVNAAITCEEITGTGIVRLTNATINTTDLDSTATIILSGANKLVFGENPVTIGRFVFADPSAKLTLSGTGDVTYSESFKNSTCLSSSELYVPADYKAAAVDGVISVTPSYEGYVKNKLTGTTGKTWADSALWDDDYPAESGKRYLVDGNGASVRFDSPTVTTITFPGDVLTLKNGKNSGSPVFLALKSTNTTIDNLRLGESSAVDFRTNGSGTQTLAGNIYLSTENSQGASIRGNKGITNIVTAAISGEGILRIVPHEKGPGCTTRLTGDNSAYVGKIYVDWFNSNGTAPSTLIVDDVKQLGGNPSSAKSDGLRINASTLVVNETMTLPANRGLTFLREATIDVAAGKTFTAPKSAFYKSTDSFLIKTGAGALVLGAVTTYDNSKTITVKEGTVTLPKTATYTLGENTAVLCSSDDTVTLGPRTFYTVSFEATGCKVTDVEGNVYDADYSMEAGDFLFKVAVDADYELESVLVNGVAAEDPVDGVYTAPISGNTTITATAKKSEGIDPTDPEPQDVKGTTKEEAYTNLKVAIPAAVTTKLGEKAPSADTYKSYFKYTYIDKGNGKFTVTMTGIADEVTADVSESITDGFDSVTVPAGLYYKVTTGTAVGKIETEAAKGLSDGNEVSITKPGTAQGFVKVQIGAGAID